MIDFDQLKVTIMVVIAELEGNIDIDAIFPLLKITKVPLPETKRRTKRQRIPPCNIRGAIVSARYRGVSRGVARDSYFRNSILIDISNGTKNINIKLSRNSMHICGSKSLDMARDAVELLLDKVRLAAKMAEEYKARKDELRPILLERTKGRPVIVGGLLRHLLATDKNSEDGVIGYLLDLASEFAYYEDFVTQLDWLEGLGEIISSPSLKQLNKVMVNYNYDIGFEVDRKKLVSVIDGVNGFTASYENTLQHNVTIVLPYENTSGKARKRSCHTFIVYRSGFVTQSGPDEERMKEAYELFFSTIREIRPLIEKV
jgi:hypothetical protein